MAQQYLGEEFETAADRHLTILETPSDNISIMSSEPGTSENTFPDRYLEAYLRPVNGAAPKVKRLKAKLDTGAQVCLIAERVVASRFGMERIDQEKWHYLDPLGTHELTSLGQIRIVIRVKGKEDWVDVPFQVVPDSFVRKRWDALLDTKFIHRYGILVEGPVGRTAL